MNQNLIPTHIAIIPDGNRRWAKLHDKTSLEGHKKGYEVCQAIARKAWDMGVKIVTLWGFSTENWGRTPAEVDALMTLFEYALEHSLQEAISKEARLLHIGRKDRLSNTLRKKIQSAEDQTSKFTERYLVVGLDYGGRDEVLRAVNTIVANTGSERTIDAPSFEKNLDTGILPQQTPDLIIRTGGERRTSGFMLWQADYSEWLFVDTLLPDFTVADFEQCVIDFQNRKRRFGK